jgi:beta-xylosidase
MFACLYLCFGFYGFNCFAQTYTNPVIAGDFPDPSVIRVGDDYYASATSGGWAPSYPILHSKDLINWRIVGSIFQTKPAWVKGDFWAPELAVDKGKFYVFYTARRDDGKGKKGTLCVAVAVSDKPDSGYVDKGALVCQEMGSIDAFFARDENEKPYLIWKEDGNDRQQPTWMYAQELEESLTKVKGKPKKLFRNEGAGWENHVVEGADVVRRGDWFYMFYSGNACCGRGCNYALGVARSRKLLGPWEKNPKNPILAANDAWQCPGHGTIVKTPDGRDFMLYHAYRRGSEAFNIGREALLDEIEWTADGWATINNGRGASKEAKIPFVGTVQQKRKELVENFDLLSAAWTFPLDSTRGAGTENGFLQFQANGKDELVAAHRAFSGDYTATTRVLIDKLPAKESASLSAYSWRGSAVGIGIGDGKIFAWRRENGKNEIAAATEMLQTKEIYLRMTAKDGEFYNFSYSADNREWREIGGNVAGGHVEGARIALLYNGKSAVSPIKFDWLKVTQ